MELYSIFCDNLFEKRILKGMNIYVFTYMGFHGGLAVKNLPAVQETRVQSLGQEDPLEEGMATHSSILCWRVPGTEEPGGLQSVGSHRVGHDRVTKQQPQHSHM